MTPQASLVLSFAVLAAIAAGSAHAHCSAGPNVTCVYDPGHHGEREDLQGGAQVARNSASPEAKAGIGRILIIPKLNLPVSPPEAPVVPKLSAPVGQLPPVIAAPVQTGGAPAVPVIRTQDDIDKVQVKVLSTVRDGDNAQAVLELMQKNPKAAAQAANQMAGERLGEVYKELQRWQGALTQALQHGTAASPAVNSGIENMRQLTDTLTYNPNKKPR